MIFTQPHIKLIEQGLKWQTRRLVREGDQVVFEYVGVYTTHGPVVCPTHAMELPLSEVYHIIAVLHANGRTKWEVGRNYAMQPGRCEKAVGRIPPLTSIRLQRLQDISEADAVAEGCQARYVPGVNRVAPVALYMTAVELYAEVWNEINRRKADHWDKNPWVFALGWEPVGEG